MQITTVNSKTMTDFGNLFNDWESELCKKSNTVERRTWQNSSKVAHSCLTERHHRYYLWRHNSILAPPKYHIQLVGACAWCPADTYTRLHEITIILTDKHTRLGMDSGVCENCEKLDALWSLLRLLWSRSRAVVATCLTDYSIQFCILSMHVWIFAKPADIQFPQER